MHADWCSLRLPYHNLPKRSSIIARCTDTIWLKAASTDPTIQNQRKQVPSVALFPPNFQPFATQCKTRRLLLRLASRWLNVLFYWVLAALQESMRQVNKEMELIQHHAIIWMFVVKCFPPLSSWWAVLELDSWAQTRHFIVHVTMHFLCLHQ